MPNELLSADALIAWLRQQPPDGQYVWQDPVHCLLGRYLRANGSRWGEVIYSEMPGYDEIAAEKPWTYGAALERAEALQLPPPAKALPPPEELHREPLLIASAS